VSACCLTPNEKNSAISWCQQFISRCILGRFNSIIEIRPKKKLKVAFNDSEKQNVYTNFSISFLQILIGVVSVKCVSMPIMD
jgi:hypothetical protein